MAKPINEKDRINYAIERISTKMSREELNELYNEYKSDDDYVNFHLENIEDTHNKFYVTIMNDEVKSPVKNSDENQSYGFMKVKDALDFVNDYIDNGRSNSKTKAVMQQGYSKKSLDKYNALVEQEEKESYYVDKFTKPTFEDIMNNVYLNDFRGTIYNEPDEFLPDELREDVGVIIPGVIENREEYFEFVKRLKDRGKNGLGRSIYAKYEEYEEAVELIDLYKQALYDKYGSKDDFFRAKQLGGMFGAYEYYPEVRPRFKRTQRNIKLSKGMNLNELALIEDMGRRIREEYDNEINNTELSNDDVVIYENTPPKFRDLPDNLKMFYTTDKYGINGFSFTDGFKSLKDYADELIKSSDPEKQYEGYLIKEELEREEAFYINEYESNFVNVTDLSILDDKAIPKQLEYDKIMFETNNDSFYVDSVIDTLQESMAYMEFVKNQLYASGKYDCTDPIDKTKVTDLAEHATNYIFKESYKNKYDERNKVNSAGDILYREVEEMKLSNKEREEMNANESKVKHYVNEMLKRTRNSLEYSSSNADKVMNTTTRQIDQHDVCSGEDRNIDYSIGFDIKANPKDLLKYMKTNETLAKRVYEIGSDNNAGYIFSERAGIDEFVDEISKSSKPMITEEIIDKSMKNSRKVVK